MDATTFDQGLQLLDRILGTLETTKEFDVSSEQLDAVLTVLVETWLEKATSQTLETVHRVVCGCGNNCNCAAH